MNTKLNSSASPGLLPLLRLKRSSQNSFQWLLVTIINNVVRCDHIASEKTITKRNSAGRSLLWSRGCLCQRSAKHGALCDETMFLLFPMIARRKNEIKYSRVSGDKLAPNPGSKSVDTLFRFWQEGSQFHRRSVMFLWVSFYNNVPITESNNVGIWFIDIKHTRFLFNRKFSLLAKDFKI